MNPFFIGEAVGFGWKTFKTHWLFFLGLMLLLALVNFIPNYVSSLIPSNLAILAGIINLVGWIFNLVLGVGLIKIALNFVDSGNSNFKDLFLDVKVIIFYILTAIVVGVITMLGFILLIVPGVILAIRLQFWPYLLVDKKLGPIQAIKGSWLLTAGYGWDLVGFGLALAVLNLLGLLLLVVGLVVTAPISMLATASLYRSLENKVTIVT